MTLCLVTLHSEYHTRSLASKTCSFVIYGLFTTRCRFSNMLVGRDCSDNAPCCLTLIPLAAHLIYRERNVIVSDWLRTTDPKRDDGVGACDGVCKAIGVGVAVEALDA